MSPVRKDGEKSPRMHWYLHLTFAEAEVRKWVYSGALFAIIAVVVLGPTRYYISKRALSGHDPFGWAVGYLFGQIEPVRGVIESFSCANGLSYLLQRQAGEMSIYLCRSIYRRCAHRLDPATSASVLSAIGLQSC